MIMIIATILFGMERLRKEIIVLSRPYDIRHAQQVRTESQRHSFSCIRIDFEPNPVSRLSEPDHPTDVDEVLGITNRQNRQTVGGKSPARCTEELSRVLRFEFSNIQQVTSVQVIRRPQTPNGDPPAIKGLTLYPLFQNAFKWISRNAHRERHLPIGTSLAGPLNQLRKVIKKSGLNLAFNRWSLGHKREGPGKQNADRDDAPPQKLFHFE